MTQTPAWISRRDLDPLAAAMADLVFRQASAKGAASEDDADGLARLAALLVLERGRGHGCVSPEDWAAAELPVELPLEHESAISLPDRASWRRLMDIDAVVSRGGDLRALVWRDDETLALWRDHRAETRLATRFAEMLAAAPTEAVPSAAMIDTFDALFPGAAPEGQALAVATAARACFSVITGGPGTGKTTTIVRVIAVLISARPDLRVRVVAPTGKAASRLAQSIRDQRAGMGLDAAIVERIPSRVDTVHRALRYRPDRERFGHDRDHPLEADVVIVDEASMLDLGLMDALVDALPSGARLVLVGDRDQLASVDAGAVLSDVVGARAGERDARSAAFAAWTAPFFTPTCPIDDRADALDDAVAELRQNFRFAPRPGLAELADALRTGDADLALEVLANENFAAVHRVDPPGDGPGLELWIDRLLEGYEEQTVRDRQARLARVQTGGRILAALRRGRLGVEGLNRLVESRLRAKGWKLDSDWYEGRPILVERNAPELELFNGDLGLLTSAAADPSRPVALFSRESDDGEPAWREIPVARLPPHATAWSMTVHKSQGSEFQEVVLVLPAGRHPLLSRELLYTGVTRARSSVLVVADEDAVARAVRQVQRRRTGLAQRLKRAREARQG